jgi:hypothetical protein
MKHLLGSLMLIVPGLAMVLVGLQHAARERASPGWPTTGGVVQSSSIEERRGRGGPTYYYPIVSYRYEVGGITFTGHQISYSPTSYSDPQSAQADANRYPEGSTVQVHYSPGEPWESVLEPGPAEYPWILPVVGGLLVVIGAAGLIQLWRFQTKLRRVQSTN